MNLCSLVSVCSSAPPKEGPHHCAVHALQVDDVGVGGTR